jgi:NADPH-dependent 2,4-dienoyl-CoA reductase/sulfur reductase-like enzyme
MAQLLIIGGSDAGISAALRAREVDPNVEVTVVVADAYPNYSICGLPYYLSGEVADWRDLAHRTADEIRDQGIRLLLEHTALSIDPMQHSVTVRNRAGREYDLHYDRLIIGTGAEPVTAPIRGTDLPGVHLLHSMDAARRMYDQLSDGVRSVTIVGGGYVGLEMADALRHRGLEVRLIVRSGQVLRRALSEGMSHAVEEELARQGVDLVRGVTVRTVRRHDGGLLVMGEGQYRGKADAVLVAVGVRPATALAKTAGLPTGVGGALLVDRHMATSIPGIYAAGDCVETWHRILREYTYLPLGTTAHKQGRVAGENAAGGHREFAGTLGTQTVKVFDLAVARTGLLEQEAEVAGYDVASHSTRAWDHKAYYPGARELLIQLIGDRESGRLLGAQIIGDRRSEVSKRLDIYATAIHHAMGVDEISDLDLSYTPPFGSPWDAVQMAAQDWVAAHGR